MLFYLLFLLLRLAAHSSPALANIRFVRQSSDEVLEPHGVCPDHHQSDIIIPPAVEKHLSWRSSVYGSTEIRVPAVLYPPYLPKIISSWKGRNCLAFLHLSWLVGDLPTSPGGRILFCRMLCSLRRPWCIHPLIKHSTRIYWALHCAKLWYLLLYSVPLSKPRQFE